MDAAQVFVFPALGTLQADLIAVIGRDLYGRLREKQPGAHAQASAKVQALLGGREYTPDDAHLHRAWFYLRTVEAVPAGPPLQAPVSSDAGDSPGHHEAALRQLVGDELYSRLPESYGECAALVEGSDLPVMEKWDVQQALWTHKPGSVSAEVEAMAEVVASVVVSRATKKTPKRRKSAS